MEKTKIMIECHEKFVADDLAGPNIHGMLDEMLALHDKSVVHIDDMEAERQTFIEGLQRLDTGWVHDALGDDTGEPPRFFVQVTATHEQTWYVYADNEEDAFKTVVAAHTNGCDPSGCSHDDLDWDNAKVTRSPV